MAHRSTAISYWVATCVLCQAKLEERVFMMSKFVQLGEELRLLNNYQYVFVDCFKFFAIVQPYICMYVDR